MGLLHLCSSLEQGHWLPLFMDVCITNHFDRASISFWVKGKAYLFSNAIKIIFSSGSNVDQACLPLLSSEMHV